MRPDYFESCVCVLSYHPVCCFALQFVNYSQVNFSSGFLGIVQLQYCLLLTETSMESGSLTPTHWRGISCTRGDTHDLAPLAVSNGRLPPDHYRRVQCWKSPIIQIPRNVKSTQLGGGVLTAPTMAWPHRHLHPTADTNVANVNYTSKGVF